MIEDKLARARAAYTGKLRSSLEQLDTLLRQARQGDHQALAEAQGLAHRLCGTSGTFGFAEASQATGFIDSELFEVLEGKRAATAELWQQIEAALQRASRL